ncbi:hypothetical protein SAMN05444487_10270 [Marininema mesophilum]|uniref:Uncharacterized protein n=1 Tax=Marininema mesophilum TaxID=1048340 RepID=A0A1H2S1B1_9BACL|nr:hypothetical protein [Marininema mesophilum]SDW25401.1 hypothetical protein SAMN05444487_10270 [Marininema mesophilum]
MSEPYDLRYIRAESSDGAFELKFENAQIILDAPSPWNLKSWSVLIYGVDASGADQLDDCYYHGRSQLNLVMETEGGKSLQGRVILEEIAVGPRSRALFDGLDTLEGFTAL